MSNISNQNDVVKFVSGKSVPLPGQRLAKVVFKTPRGENAGEKKDSVCVSVPFILDSEIAGSINALMPHVAEMIYKVQDSIIREKVLEGATVIANSDISLKEVLWYLDAESIGDRLTKEIITAWFEEELQDTLTVAIGDKMGISDTPTEAQAKMISQTIAAYKGSFAACAGGKTWFEEKKVKNLQKALEFVSDTGHSVYQKLATRLASMLENKKKLGADLMAL